MTPLKCRIKHMLKIELMSWLSLLSTNARFNFRADEILFLFIIPN